MGGGGGSKNGLDPTLMSGEGHVRMRVTRFPRLKLNPSSKWKMR